MTRALLQPNPYLESDYGIVAAETAPRIWLWHCCSRAHIPNLTRAVLQPISHPKYDYGIICSRILNPDSDYGIVAAHIQNLTMALLQPTSKIWLWHCCSKSKHPKIFLWHGCNQAHNPNLTMALMQQKQASKILLWHCCSQARNPHHTIALLQQKHQNPQSDYGIVAAQPNP